MSATTQCPTCNTRFKVSAEQLDAHQGLVRCGRCQAVFNATEYLQNEQPSPQLDLPIAAETSPPSPVDIFAEAITEHSSAIPEEIITEPDSAASEAADLSLAEQARYEWHDPETEPAILVTLAQTVAFENGSPHNPAPTKKKLVWPWIAGSLLMVFVLLAQAAYFFRVELAANNPGLKPALISYCSLLQCSVPLPQKADLMSIESSDLEAEPGQTTAISLNALLRNHAPYTQAYPQLELTLTDAQDKPLARRTFRPAEYLKAGEDEALGLAANRELNVKLNLDTADLKPSGYRLLLFYPQ